MTMTAAIIEIKAVNAVERIAGIETLAGKDPSETETEVVIAVDLNSCLSAEVIPLLLHLLKYPSYRVDTPLPGLQLLIGLMLDIRMVAHPM